MIWLRMSEQMQSKLFRDRGKRGDNVAPSPLESLSDRELEVFRLVGQGVGTSRIAGQLNLSISTGYSHRAKIKAELGADNGTELLQHAVKWVETDGSG
jgi:DNA-binding CsgD family transcriptional regulator